MKKYNDNIPFQIKKKGTSNEELATQLAEKVSQVNGISPVNGNVTIPVPQVDTSTLATKAEIANIGNASPKGTYATLSALQTAFPTGTTGIYVVTADGKWYYWNGSAWTAGGTYQATGIADDSLSYSKLTPVLKSVAKRNGLQDFKWTVGFRDSGGSIGTDQYCILSDMFYLNVGDSITYDSTKATGRFKLWNYSTDGITYNATNSLTAWQSANFTATVAGYYRIHISYFPTSTTIIDGTNAPTLESAFSLNSTYLDKIDGSNIKDNTVSISKLNGTLSADKINLDSRMAQACIGGFGFSYGFVPTTANKAILQKNKFTFLGDSYALKQSTTPTSATSYGVLFPTGGTVSYLSDICVVGDELWCFSTGYNDRSGYSNVWRFKYDPVNNSMENRGFFWCDFGHCNTVNYNPVTDSLIMSNGSDDYTLANQIFIISNVTAIKALPSGSTVNLANYGIIIDATGYSFGAKLNVFWANENSGYANYATTTDYIPNTAYAYADDGNKLYIIALGYGTNQYTYGTYSAPTGNGWNGTYNVIASYQDGDPNEVIGASGSYIHVGQGGDSIGGVAYIGRGHSAKWWSEISFGISEVYRKDVYIPFFNPTTGAIQSKSTRGIAVTKDYLIVAFDTNIYYLPR